MAQLLDMHKAGEILVVLEHWRASRRAGGIHHVFVADHRGRWPGGVPNGSLLVQNSVVRTLCHFLDGPSRGRPNLV